MYKFENKKVFQNKSVTDRQTYLLTYRQTYGQSNS